jgi:uncharacterized protein DUF3105
VKLATTALERVAILVASLLLSVGLIALLSGYFAGHDPAGVSVNSSGPGQAFHDDGDLHLRPGELRPLYDSEPPTSGAHISAPVTRQETELSDDQVLTALEVGDVVILYGGRRPPPGLTTLLGANAPPFTPALAATGQAIVIGHRSGITGLIALAWAHMAQVSAPNDPLLHSFTQFWLGRGAQSH